MCLHFMLLNYGIEVKVCKTVGQLLLKTAGSGLIKI